MKSCITDNSICLAPQAAPRKVSEREIALICNSVLAVRVALEKAKVKMTPKEVAHIALLVCNASENTGSERDLLVQRIVKIVGDNHSGRRIGTGG